MPLQVWHDLKRLLKTDGEEVQLQQKLFTPNLSRLNPDAKSLAISRVVIRNSCRLSAYAHNGIPLQ